MFGKGNPTGNPRKPSAGTRRKKERRLDKDLEGTPWAKSEADKAKDKAKGEAAQKKKNDKDKDKK